MTTPYSLLLPPVIHVGDGAVSRLSDEIVRLGRRPMIVTDRMLRPLLDSTAVLDAVTGRGATVSVHEQPPGEPTTDDVAHGLDALRATDADVVVAIGGGSVIDTAKAIAVMATHPGSIADYGGADRFLQPRLPLVAAPTTAGTGSEVTRFTIITEPASQVKMLIADRRLVPDVAIVDPALTYGCPPAVTASTGLDALTHAIEAFVSRRATAFTDPLALDAARRIGQALDAAWRDGDDRVARREVMIGALHAGIAFGNASVALVHGMSRPIGAYFHVPHGIANAMLLPTVLRYSLDVAPERYRDLAQAIGLPVAGLPPSEACEQLVAWVTALVRRLGVPSLTQYGLDPAKVRRVAPRMAADALASGSPANNPRVPELAEIVALYEQAL